MEGHWEFLGEGGGGGVLKAKILEAKYETKLEFPWAGGGGCKTKTFCGGSIRVPWTILRRTERMCSCKRKQCP